MSGVLPTLQQPTPRMMLFSRSSAVSLVLSAAVALMATTAPARAAKPLEDTMANRVQACTACHGAEGRAAPDGYYPRIAGKPAGYLYNQLMHFRDGARTYRPMTHLLEPLSPAYLQDMAIHFAGLSLPYPPPAPTTVSPPLLARGKELALQGDKASQLPACTACHGTALTGVQPNTPGLLGLPRDYVNSQLGAWQAGARRAAAPDCMAQVARRLSPTDVSAVSAWLAQQPLPATTSPASKLAAPPPLECGSVPQPGLAATSAGQRP